MNLMRSIMVFAVLFFTSNMLSAQINFSYVDDQYAMEKQAETQKKPFVVYFTMDVCPPCERMKKEVFSDPEIANIANQKYLTYSVNINQHGGKQLADFHNVQAAPTMLLFDAFGNFVERIDGSVSVSTLKRILANHSSAEVPNTDFSDFR